jgi:wyosine [tRNA(Phe)-imidazoG37] synthetase (radical SAM superfamily)
MIAFGPVPSRRLGQSLGINNIPPKNCSYACVYCQVGKTSELKHRRNEKSTILLLYRMVNQRWILILVMKLIC